MPLTTSIVTLVDYMVDKFKLNAEALDILPEDVYYGDQERLPRSPAICVEPGSKSRVLDGQPRKTMLVPVVYVFAYHLEVRSPQANRRDADLFAEAVETLIHADPTMNRTVIHSMVTDFESGYANKSSSLVRATRLTVEFKSQELLPLPVP